MIEVNVLAKLNTKTSRAIIKTTFFSSSMLLQKPTPTTTPTSVAKIMEAVPICLMVNRVFGVSSNIYLLISSP